MKSIITDISFCECVDSAYVKPRRMLYVENGAKRSWDFIHSLDSVSVLLYHTQKQSLLFVKQFRPPVFVRHFGESYLESSYLESNKGDSKTQDEVGYTYELCAGLVDKKGKSVEQIAKEEIEEECGYKVNNLEYITSFATAVGHSGAKQSLFYAEINENDRVSTGGGIDGEVIESVFVKVDCLEQFLYDESKIKTPGLAFGVMWFLRNKKYVNK
ncbi:NUDIX hydrolase [Helicobacter cinaedi]|uniref:NUDIX hydrolase n=1 Tax=Helicobacter cinaedi TaxID=213 RepID=UPI001F1BFC76|nr:NUDIX hydrolase [Helicobacter cinaedi]BDB65344.1 NUDIX hydrolase [Helicobacter cinaedi]